MTRYRLQLAAHDAVEVSADGALDFFDRCQEYAQRCGFGSDAQTARRAVDDAFAVFVGNQLVAEGTAVRLDGTA